jgi:hypothetical protein
MTLNLTIGSSWLIGQTSDFKLGRIQGIGSSDESSQKQFVIKYRDWAGLLCYTDIAEYHSHNTADWLTEILTRPSSARLSPDSVIDSIKQEGDMWLPTVESKLRRHTFTLACFYRLGVRQRRYRRCPCVLAAATHHLEARM